MPGWEALADLYNLHGIKVMTKPKFNPGDIVRVIKPTCEPIPEPGWVYQMDPFTIGNQTIKSSYIHSETTCYSLEGSSYTYREEWLVKATIGYNSGITPLLRDLPSQENVVQVTPGIRLECQSGKMSKFWESVGVKVGDCYYLLRRWGKIGKKGQSKVEKKSTIWAVRTTRSHLVWDKKRKGYQEIQQWEIPTVPETPFKQEEKEQKTPAKAPAKSLSEVEKEKQKEAILRRLRD